MGMMILDAKDLRILAEQGLLTEVIMKCTVGGIAEQGGTVEVKPAEAVKDGLPDEKPSKKKRASKKKTEEAVAEASQEVAETTAPSPVGLETAVEAPSVSEPVSDEVSEPAVAVEEFNIEMLAQKAIAVMDAGGQDALQALLKKFGVASLPELAPENYAAFYNELEEL